MLRTSRRIGGDDVKVIVRSGFDEMRRAYSRRRKTPRTRASDPEFPVPKYFRSRTERFLEWFSKSEGRLRRREKILVPREPDQFLRMRRRVIARGQ
jgi:hypothetical protein